MSKQFEFEEELFLDDGTVLAQVPDYPAYYADVENGELYSFRTSKLKKMKTHERPGEHNYVTTTLQNDLGARCMGVHEVIMAAYQGTWDWKEQGYEVDHKNERKNRNNVDNLRLITHDQQYSESVRAKMSMKKKGSAHPGAKLDENDVKEIRQRLNDYDGLKCDFAHEMAIEFGVVPGTINSVIYGNTWSHVE